MDPEFRDAIAYRSDIAGITRAKAGYPSQDRRSSREILQPSKPFHKRESLPNMHATVCPISDNFATPWR